ncbi:YbaB/EbfC family nucleoid-associated protein [Legionella jordanis]|uniref:Nucleoid-associated protein Ljor_0330 n=1 Tax=Legionella jordanis TaxID=456 RepID=A0A0W0VEY7_9GAMM|nr:YbaB/EbfC family nucleoid-associated protein [Legionella jordanis]KTD18666.1 Nucleoid-associated protein YbaB [Legionella jordanis]RMX00825.1 YbaB/EbfC family nucleoid-associated protein [Legionella jordanis]RMX17968.1 YbaB/EbfC family nucleoid-associated protein [Legionella jordanis]VEH11542.1 DNA-binding protein, YbaB/EbfC family [Legionella jordanis]HAT8715113.1 YbaB/EbfC family nucleoid-associated protein [Legionella jordanis]
MDINQNLGNIMKEAQKMQQRMQEAQKQLSELSVKGVSGGGMVEVEMKGNHEVSKVKIKQSLMDEDVEMLEDLVVAAFNDASRKVEQESKRKISELTAGLNIPTDFMKDREKE